MVVSATSILCWHELIHWLFFHSVNRNSDLAGQRTQRHSYCDSNHHQDIQGRTTDNHASGRSHVGEAGVTMQEVPIASQRYAHPCTPIRSIGSDRIPNQSPYFLCNDRCQLHHHGSGGWARSWNSGARRIHSPIQSSTWQAINKYQQPALLTSCQNNLTVLQRRTPNPTCGTQIYKGHRITKQVTTFYQLFSGGEQTYSNPQLK